jgi:hypothetical protein
MTMPKYNHVLNSDYPELNWELEGDYEYEKIQWHLSEGQAPPSKEVLESKLAKLQADYDSKKYQRDRKYPELGEQFDLLFKDIDSGKVNKDGVFYKALKAVKDAHPKPE